MSMARWDLYENLLKHNEAKPFHTPTELAGILGMPASTAVKTGKCMPITDQNGNLLGYVLTETNATLIPVRDEKGFVVGYTANAANLQDSPETRN